MKKYFIIAAAAALALASCAKFETYTETNDELIPIAFSNYTPKALAKASSSNYVAGTELVNGAAFDVYGWTTDNGTSFTGSNGTKFTDWYRVVYNGGGEGTNGSANTYATKLYWPSGDNPKYLSFFAYYPSNASGITAPANGLGAFTFTAASTAATQADFMVADVVKDQTYGHTNSSFAGTVDLTFRHQLTKVQVKFKTTTAIVNDTNTDITVTGATFNKINNTGTLTASYNGTATSTVWSAVSGTESYDIAHPAGALTATASTVAAADVFLMVPQTMLVNSNANAQYIEVSWNTTTNGVSVPNTKKIYLDDCVTEDGGSTAANIDWVKNNFVTYIITIAPEQIYFTGVAEGWAGETIGYYNIN